MKILGAMRPLWALVAGLIAIGFGLLTIVTGANVLFGPEEARRAAGSYLPWLVWFNVVGAFAYVTAGAGLWLGRNWVAPLAFGIAIATAAAFGAFGLHVAAGGAYEMRTVGAMLMRTILWTAIAIAACPGAGCPLAKQAR